MCNDILNLFSNMGYSDRQLDALSLVLDSNILIFCHMQSFFITFTSAVEHQPLVPLPRSILDPVFTCSVMTASLMGQQSTRNRDITLLHLSQSVFLHLLLKLGGKSLGLVTSTFTKDINFHGAIHLILNYTSKIGQMTQ